ncbi:MAG: energy transducer TonB [Pyrinomonadaceae bacterium]
MFDKLIESEPEGADFKNRSSYFMVSSLVVGILFVTAVVISIYAGDIGLGTQDFELTEMLAPVDMAATAPERPKQMPATQSQSTSPLPTRQVNMASVDEPTHVPQTTSTAVNTQMSRPDTGRFIYGSKFDTNGGVTNISGRDSAASASTGETGLSTIRSSADDSTDVEPPPARIEKPIKKAPPQTLGVINGKATYLPKPAYSAAAKAVHAQGSVNVQVMIDESGNVISAHAAGGHPLLRSAAEQAAKNAKFSTTYLSKIPVKVTGIIVYNFVL